MKLIVLHIENNMALYVLATSKEQAIALAHRIGHTVTFSYEKEIIAPAMVGYKNQDFVGLDEFNLKDNLRQGLKLGKEFKLDDDDTA